MRPCTPGRVRAVPRQLTFARSHVERSGPWSPAVAPEGEWAPPFTSCAGHVVSCGVSADPGPGGVGSRVRPWDGRRGWGGSHSGSVSGHLRLEMTVPVGGETAPPRGWSSCGGHARRSAFGVQAGRRLTESLLAVVGSRSGDRVEIGGSAERPGAVRYGRAALWAIPVLQVLPSLLASRCPPVDWLAAGAGGRPARRSLPRL